MKKYILLLIAILFLSSSAAYSDNQNYDYFAMNYGLKCTKFKDSGKKIEYCYALFNKKNKEPYTLLLVLHSGIERGDNLQALTFPALKPLFEYATKNNKKLLVLIPQYPRIFGHFSEENNKLVVRLVKKYINQYNIPHKKIYITGASLGGKATHSIIYDNPVLFSKALLVSYISSKIEILKKFEFIELYYVYGENDYKKLPELLSKQKQLPFKMNMKYKILKNKNHIETIDEAYYDSELWDWMFKEK